MSEESEWDELIYDCFIEVFEEIEMEELVEKVARTMALGNNGGGWATHYTTEQQDVWRERAKEVIEMVKEGLVK